MVLCKKCAEIRVSDGGVKAVKKSLDSCKENADYNVELDEITVLDLIQLAEKCNSVNQRNIMLIAYTHAHIAVSENAPKWNCSICLEEIFHAGLQRPKA